MNTLRKFYFAWALSSWGDRMWYFALSMYFIVINENSLLITALNGFIVNLVAIFLGALIGNLIDKHQRINVVRISLIVQNFTVGLSCIAVIFLLHFKEFSQTTWNGSFFYIVQGFIILFNVIGNLSSTAISTSVQRDWVIVVAKNDYFGDDSAETNPDTDSTKKFNSRLASINAFLRAINLTTGIVAPLLAGVVMASFNIYSTYNGTIISAACFAIWNFVSCFAEYFLMLNIYKQVPALKKESVKSENSSSNNPITTIYKSWAIYIKQGALVLPGIAFSFLFLTVLGFDEITLGYAKSQKLTEIFIALFRGIGSLSGILATVAFPILHNRFKIFLPYIGWLGLGYQVFFLLVCFTAIWLPGSPFVLGVEFLSTMDSGLLESNVTCIQHGYSSSAFEKFWFEPSCHSYTSIIVLLSGMAMSRFGLWLNDLSVNQIMQENVDECERGTVGGVQASLNKIFDLIKFGLVICLSDISYYGYLVIISVVMTSSSLVLFSVYVIKERVELKNNQVPLSEAGPFRKSMIVMVKDKEKTDDLDSFDSFYESDDDEAKVKLNSNQ